MCNAMCTCTSNEEYIRSFFPAIHLQLTFVYLVNSMAALKPYLPFYAKEEVTAWLWEQLVADREGILPHSDKSVFSVETNVAVAEMQQSGSGKTDDEEDDGEDEEEVDLLQHVVDVTEFESR